MTTQPTDDIAALHRIIENLCNLTEEIVKHLKPEDMDVFQPSTVTLGCIAHGARCLRSISLLTAHGYISEPHMVFRNLVESHAMLTDIMKNDKFYEFEYRSRHELIKSFRKREKALRSALSEAEDNAQKDKLRIEIAEAEEAIKHWDGEFRSFGRSMVERGIWDKIPEIKKVYKFSSVKDVFGELSLHYVFLHSVPSTIAVHAKSPTWWNDLVFIVSGKPGWTKDHMVALLNNAAIQLFALVADGLKSMNDNPNVREFRKHFITNIEKDLNERTNERMSELLPLVGVYLKGHLLQLT